MACNGIVVSLAVGQTGASGASAGNNASAWIVWIVLGLLSVALVIWSRIRYRREVKRAKKSRWATWLDDPNATSGDEGEDSRWSD
jgi:Na+-driven multidrug efflux pump